MGTMSCYHCLNKKDGKYGTMEFIGRDSEDEKIGRWKCTNCNRHWILIEESKVKLSPTQKDEIKILFNRVLTELLANEEASMSECGISSKQYAGKMQQLNTEIRDYKNQLNAILTSQTE